MSQVCLVSGYNAVCFVWSLRLPMKDCSCSQIPRKLMLQGSSGDVGTDSSKSSSQTVCVPTGWDTFALFPDPISTSWHEDILFKVNISTEILKRDWYLVTLTLKLAFSPNIKYFSPRCSAVWNWSVWLLDQCYLSHQPINPTKPSVSFDHTAPSSVHRAQPTHAIQPISNDFVLVTPNVLRTE